MDGSSGPPPSSKTRLAVPPVVRYISVNTYELSNSFVSFVFFVVNDFLQVDKIYRMKKRLIDGEEEENGKE